VKQKPWRTLACGEWIETLSWSPNGKVIAAAGTGQTLIRWRTADWTKMPDLTKTPDLEAFADYMDSMALAFSPDGRLFAESTLSSLPYVLLWDANTWQYLDALPSTGDDIRCVSFSHDGRYLATGDENDTLRIIDLRSRRSLFGYHVRNINVDDEWVTGVDFSRDDRLLVVAAGAKVLVYDTGTWRVRSTIAERDRQFAAVAFSPDGRQFAASNGKYDAHVLIYDTASGKVLHRLEGFTDMVEAVGYSHNGKYLGTAGGDHSVKLWQAETGRLLREYEGHQNRATSVGFSPDDKLMATGSTDHTIKLWRTF
jgi:WD40 repeat protein